MKATILSVFGLVVCVALAQESSFAQVSSDRLNTYEAHKDSNRSSVALFDAKAKFSYCVRSLIENSGHGLDGFDQVISYLEGVSKAQSRVQLFYQNQYKECSKLREMLRGNKVTRKEKWRFATVNERRMLKPVFSLIQDVLNPEVNCTLGGIQVGTAPLVAFGVRVEGGYCTSTTGRRWIEIGLGGTLGIGAGPLCAMITGLEETRREINHAAPVTSRSFDANFTAAFLFGMQLMDNEKGRERFGAGVGMCAVYEKNGVSYLRVPMGSKSATVVSLVDGIF